MRMRDESELPSSGGEHFIKLKDQESVTGVFQGEPYEFYLLWKDRKSTVVPQGTTGAQFRFRLNMVVREKSGYVAKIFEQGTTVYRRLIKLNTDFQGLENIVVKVTRHGSARKDTEYFVDPVMDPKNPRQLLQVPSEATKVELLKLSHDQGKAEEGPPADLFPPDELPF